MAELETVLTRRREDVEAKGASYTKAMVFLGLGVFLLLQHLKDLKKFHEIPT